jgi:hypothetical protein
MVVTGGAQTIEFAAGTASAPSITTTGDTNTGIFFPAADTIAFSEGGTEAMRINSSGQVGIGETAPACRLYVKESGTVLTPDAGTVAVFQRNSADFNGAVVSIIGGNAGSSTLHFGDVDSQGVGSINYDHSDNSMRVVTAGSERMRITSDGYLRMVSGSGGIQFNGDTAAANALDDYEEGSWTPTLVGSTTPGNHTYSANTHGTYTKIGRLVTLNFVITLASKGTIAGAIDVSNLPFSLNASGASPPNRYPVGACAWGALTTNWVYVYIGSNGATTTLRLGGTKVAGTSTVDMDAADLSATTLIAGSIQYVN